MRRSKLECYEEILGALIRTPLDIDSIAYETDMNCSILRQRLDYLMKNDLVKERVSDKKTLYAITERGTAVFKVLNFQRYLEKVANSIRVMDEALQTLSAISERRNKKENENY